LKYPWTARHGGKKGKFSCYQSELPLVASLAKDLGLPKLDEDRWARHPLNFLMEAADDICYAILDLEDAIELNLLSFDEVKPILLTLCGDLEFDDEIFATQASARRKISALRGRAMENMVDSAVQVFADQLPEIMSGHYEGELLSDGDPMVRDGLASAKRIAQERVFPDNRKAELEVGAYTILGVLVEAFIEAVWEQHVKRGEDLCYRSEKIIGLMGIHAPASDESLYNGYMRALDFISGMTDSYASYLARQIGGGIKV
jgi:dGTPase